MQIEKATPFNQSKLDLTKKQIDSMSQEDWDKLPIVTGPKPGREPKSEADKWVGSHILSETELKKAERLGKTTSPSDLTDLPKLEAEKPQLFYPKGDNRAIKITKGILRLISPSTTMDLLHHAVGSQAAYDLANAVSYPFRKPGEFKEKLLEKLGYSPHEIKPPSKNK